MTVPKWGMAMEEGTLVNWLVEEGAPVKAGDEIAEIESSKIVNVLESHYEGIMRRQIAKVDETLPLGALLAVIADADVSDAEVESFISGFTNELAGEKQIGGDPSAAITEPAGPVDSSIIAVSASGNRDDSDVRATPSARRLARELGINLHDCNATGSRGRICEDDVREASQRVATGTARVSAPAPQTGQGIVELPLSPIRERIARRLQESASTIPHYRLISDARIDRLLDLQKSLKKTVPEIRISINDLLIKACAMALVRVPDCNVQFEDGLIKRFPNADIAVAVALDSGLITPIIRAADTKDVPAISSEAAELVKKAHDGVLRPDEYEGGTFTVSNLGMFGIKQFDAIINPPQCAILAVGRGEQRIIVVDGEPQTATVLTLSLSLDHRIIDGAVGAGFMQALVEIIENPDQNIV